MVAALVLAALARSGGDEGGRRRQEEARGGKRFLEIEITGLNLPLIFHFWTFVIQGAQDS
jgi:hypothetical protein